MFRLTDEINFFEIACMYIVIFQSSPAAPSCGQSGHSRRNKKHFIRRHQNVQNGERLQTRTAHRPEATQTLSQRNTETHSTVTLST